MHHIKMNLNTVLDLLKQGGGRIIAGSEVTLASIVKNIMVLVSIQLARNMCEMYLNKFIRLTGVPKYKQAGALQIQCSLLSNYNYSLSRNVV